MSILLLFLRKNFQYRCCISRENRSKRFVKIYLCFVTYKDLHSHPYTTVSIEHHERQVILLKMRFNIKTAAAKSTEYTKYTEENLFLSLLLKNKEIKISD